MPNGNPLVGEVWETTDPTGRAVRGVLSDITRDIITLVSFTGNRFRLPPPRLTSSWQFSQAPPPTGLRCTRRGCGHPGILTFQRGALTEWVCPRHLPVGVHATLTTESLGTPRAQPGPPPQVGAAVHCLGCGSLDPVEDIRVRLPPLTSLWICHRCGARWCLIFEREAGGDPQAIFDTLNDLRVSLSVENYHIEEITTFPRIWRIFDEVVIREAGTHGRDDLLVYAGLPIRNNPTFTGNHPLHTVLRLALGGGPELRPLRAIQPAPVRVTPQNQVDRVDRPLVQTIPSTVTLPIDAALVSPMDTNNLLADMLPTPFVSVGTRWADRKSGSIVEVSRMGKSSEGEPVVHFRHISDDVEASTILLLVDFEEHFKSIYPETSAREEAVVEVLKDEEWEHIESGETVTIDSVDTKRNLVVVQSSKTRRRSVRMAEFVDGKWRRIVRRTAFARILEDD